MPSNESHPVPHPRTASVAPQVRQCRSIRPHRMRASEVAALAFLPAHAIPAQRRPDPAESRPAS